MSVRRFQRVPLPGGLGIAAPDGCVLERYEAEVVLDPGHPGNRGVAGLADAATGGRAVVTLRSQLLAPADRDVSTLLVEIANRGQAAHVPFDGYAVTAHGSVVRGPAPRPLDRDALVLRERGAVVWCGWQWDLAGTDPRLLTAAVPEVPPAVHRTHPPVTVTLAATAPAAVLPLYGLPGAASPYPVEDLDDARAELRVLTGDEPGVRVPRTRWAFTRATPAGAGPAHVAGATGGVGVWCADGFVPGVTYRLTYRSGRCPVAGAAMLAVRDVVAFLRSGEPPLPAPPATVLGYGNSQAGRFLRQFLYDGRNADENGGRVFDGLLVHAAGAQGNGLTALHAQPSRAPAPGTVAPGPYASGDLLARMPPAVRPRVLVTHTATEYWRGDAALTHLDPVHRADLPDPPGARHYLFAGLDHYGSRRPPGHDVLFPVNDVDAGLLLRAAYRALLRWVGEGVEPPPSAVPRLGDGTAERRGAVLDLLRAVTGLGVPVGLDDGDPPVLVSAVDATHNEVAGVRLPDVAVAVLTGWNPRTPYGLGATALAPLTGARLTLGAADADHAAERRCRAIAGDLAARGLLLAEDVEACVRRALRY